MQKAKKLFMLMAMLFCGMAAAWAAQTVTVIQPQNGQVTFSPATPAAGETVTITVTPDQGYCIHKADIVVSKIINPGSAQGPARIGIAENIEISGIEPTDPTLEANYTFVMPADPINVQISATFSEAPSYTVSLDPAADTENGDATFRPTEAKKGETVNIELAPVLGYQVSNVTASYMAMSTQTQVDVTKVNDLLYTFVMPAANVNVLPTFKKAKVLTPLHTILTEGVDGNDYTVAEAMAVVKVLGGDAYVTDGTDYIRLQLNDAIAEQLIEGNKSLEGTVTGKLDLRDTNPVLVVSELSENAVENDGISTAIQSVDMSQGMVPQVKLAQVVRMSGYWDGNALRAYSAAPQGQSLIITNNHMPANWQVGGNYTVTVAIYLNEAWEAEQPAGGAPRRVKAGDDLDFQNLRGELINLEITTAIDTLLMDSNVADVHYVNVAGQVSDRPFEGINIMVMKLNDGTTRTVKVVK